MASQEAPDVSDGTADAPYQKHAGGDAEDWHERQAGDCPDQGSDQTSDDRRPGQDEDDQDRIDEARPNHNPMLPLGSERDRGHHLGDTHVRSEVVTGWVNRIDSSKPLRRPTAVEHN
jgi:hypothetical protein